MKSAHEPQITVADDLLFHVAEKIQALDRIEALDERERARKEFAIFGEYFTTLSLLAQNPNSDGKTETARAFIGHHIHPGYILMPNAINLYAKHAAAFAPEERVDILSPLADLMLVIGMRWRDAECAAMNVSMSIDEISAMDTSGTITQPILDRLIAECKRIEQSLRDNLKALAEILTADTAKQAGEILVAVQDVGRKVDAVGADARRGADTAESIISKMPNPPRADKGKRHRTHKKISGAWHSAKDVAEDFNKAAFTPKGGKRKLGTCDEKKVNRWDEESPDYDHKNKWGYYAELRINSDLKANYFEVLACWLAHWEEYKRWNKQHPGVKFRPMKRTDIDTDRIGKDAEGNISIRPKTSAEIQVEEKRAKRARLSRQ